MENQKDQVVERLKQATNILVAVSTNPSVDQLSGAIGLTLLLNKLNKHATSVFSGSVPSTLEFLQPEKTLEKTTDSLRDFIIALDKSKADKLRYKVEDQMVKIFITPYMTSISEKDLEFSQGDFNVDVVITLGVNEQQDLDQAVITNGRILHDATVVSLHTQPGSKLGSINWVDEAASSLCEMLVQVGLGLKPDILDSQMATALLTGIVAETNRFSNEKTSSETMQVSAKLMAAGANQQLVATQLQQPPAQHEAAGDENLELPEINGDEEEPEGEEQQPPAPDEPPKPADGTLEINHGETEEKPETDEKGEAPDSLKTIEASIGQIHIDDEGTLRPASDSAPATPPTPSSPSTNDDSTARLMTEPPTLGGALTASSNPAGLDPSTDILGSSTKDSPILTHDKPAAPEPPAPVLMPPQATDNPVPTTSLATPTSGDHDQTLAELEELVTQGHPSPKNENPPEETVQPSPPLQTSESDVAAARDAVAQAAAAIPNQPLPPVQALNAQPMDLNLGDMPAVSTSLASAFASNSSAPSFDPPADPSSEATLTPVTTPASDSASTAPAVGTVSASTDPNAPPPVPPPLMPPAAPTMTYGQQPLPNAEDDTKSEDPLTAI